MKFPLLFHVFFSISYIFSIFSLYDFGLSVSLLVCLWLSLYASLSLTYSRPLYLSISFLTELDQAASVTPCQSFTRSIVWFPQSLQH